MRELEEGIYESLLDVGLLEALEKTQFEIKKRKLVEHEQPAYFSRHLSKLIHSVLTQLNPKKRAEFVNSLIDCIESFNNSENAPDFKLEENKGSLLMEASNSGGFIRPATPLAVSMLITGKGGDPTLEHELSAELLSSDRVDILISFIKWSGLRLLKPAFEGLAERGIPVRILTTSYMGASDPEALEWLAQRNNIEIRVSYETGRTRLHAKAYHFHRLSGFSTAYIGSANMSQAAMTSGMEWTVKISSQDMPHVIDRYDAEFETYWESRDFEAYTESDFARFRDSIQSFKQSDGFLLPNFFADITAKPYQARILEALENRRCLGSNRNLVIAATGTGKTVISALDYKRQLSRGAQRPKLLFIAHRKQILLQARDCYRAVLKDQNFGEILDGTTTPNDWDFVFASVQTLASRKPWLKLGGDYYDFVVVDEVHHGAANSYRFIFEELQAKIILGLTATPERMDGTSILPDFDGHYAAEIRLPEALEEKFLCPFHYFGVSDSIDLSSDRYWSHGKYDDKQVEQLLTDDGQAALSRLDVILKALNEYQPNLSECRGVGFCVTKKHAHYMADKFNEKGITSKALVSETSEQERADILGELREGKLKFVFSVDVLSEGVDIPEINLVMFLRPTNSLTVFLQQLGRGLRHAENKDCLTVLDFVGQMHQKYRVSSKYSALLPNERLRLDKEVENDFPHLSPGCSIQLEKVAKERVIRKIREDMRSLASFVPEVISTWQSQYSESLTFKTFLEQTGISAIDLLKNKTWSEWKVESGLMPKITDPDFEDLKKSLTRILLSDDQDYLKKIAGLGSIDEPISVYGERVSTRIHYTIWGKKAEDVGIKTHKGSIQRWSKNLSIVSDSREIAEYSLAKSTHPRIKLDISNDIELFLHTSYSLTDIKAIFGLSSLQRPGSTGVGVLHAESHRTYIHLVTFNKEEKDFSVTTRYEDYPISPTKLHWQSQSGTSQSTPTGQNYVDFKRRGYTILFFARLDRNINGLTSPYICLGQAKEIVSYHGNRPITFVWELEHAMPAAMFEETRAS